MRNRPSFLVCWAILAAFGAYFCTYAFRKPFSTGLFAGYSIGEVEYKTVIIIAQVIGYMASKFIGVKVISELKSQKRLILIVSLILVAWLSLIAFALVPAPYNIPFMFLNGLPLGMVWGIVFSFLEGRSFTELLGMGLSVNMIMTSGILKSIYRFIQLQFGFSDFNMPWIVGLLFLPLFFFFVWMLAQIPSPSKAEQRSRMSRKPMSKMQKRFVWLRYGPGLVLLILVYAMFTTLRDFRDNFAVEIWAILSPNTSSTIFAKTESLIALAVMILIAFLVMIKKNHLAFNIISIVMCIAMLGLFISTSAYIRGWLSPFQWMVALGICFYLPYLLIQIAFFERLIAVLRLKANAGFFVYLCDSVGYLGSVGLLLYKEIFAKNLAYDVLMVKFSLLVAVLGFFLLLAQFLFFSFRIKVKLGKQLNSRHSVQLTH